MKTKQQYARAFAEAVHPIFVLKGWTYWNDDGPPSVERLEDTALHLMNVCLEPGNTRCSTGRIVASRDFTSDRAELSLEFVYYYGHGDV